MLTAAATPHPDQIAAALDAISAGIEKLSASLATLRQLLTTEKPNDREFDPKDPKNKYEVGGLEKLTPRGVEICYRLFDKGLTRYAVKQAMDISFGAATHRYAAWQKAGGLERVKQPID
ncbi:MAG: hypothetical protein ACJ8ER_15830 [Allosphingosinicella sp.]